MIKLDFSPFVKFGSNRVINLNKNFIPVFLGQTGSGKSYASLDYCLSVSKETGRVFTVKDNVAFTFKDMLRLMNLPQNQGKGVCFMLEEVGVVGSGGASSEWMSKANSFFSSFLQTARHRNQILVFTTPNFSLIAKQARQLVHAIVEMKSINRTDKTSTGNVKLCQVNTITGKLYLKNIRMTIGKNKSVKITSNIFHLPPKHIIKEYEEAKTEFTTNLNNFILENDEIGTKEAKDADNFNKNDKINQENERIIELYTKNVTISAIARELNYSTNTISTRISKLIYNNKLRPRNQFNLPVQSEENNNQINSNDLQII